MKIKHRIYPITDAQGAEDINLEDEKDVRVVIDDVVTEFLLTDLFKKVYHDEGDMEGYSILFKGSNANSEPIEDGNIILGGKKIHLYIPEKDKHIFFSKVVVPTTIAPPIGVGSNYVIGISKMIGILDKADEIFAEDLSVEELSDVVKAKEEYLASLPPAEEPKVEENTNSENTEQVTEQIEGQVTEQTTEPVLDQSSTPLEGASEGNTQTAESTQVQETPTSSEVVSEATQVTEATNAETVTTTTEEPKTEEAPIVEEPPKVVYQHEVLTEDEKEEESESIRWWNKIQKNIKEKFLLENDIESTFLEAKYEDIHFKRRWLKFSRHLIDSKQYADTRKWFGDKGFEEFINDEYHFFYGEPDEAAEAYPFVLINHGKGQFQELDGAIVTDDEKVAEFEFSDGNKNYLISLNKESNEISVAEKVLQN